MNWLTRLPSWFVTILLGLPAGGLSGPLSASQTTPPSPIANGTLDPQFYDLIRRTIEQLQIDLLAVEPEMSLELLRSRLMLDALELINNVTRSGKSSDELLSLPEPLKEDAARIVDDVLGGYPASDLESDRPTELDGSAVPVRIRPYEKVLRQYLRSQLEVLVESGEHDPGPRLESIAIEAVANAAIPSNHPGELSAVEREFAIGLARSIISEQFDPDRAEIDAGLQRDLKMLSELLRRKQAELKLLGGIESIGARAERLEKYGLEQLSKVVQQRAPQGSIPNSVRSQVRALAEMIARGVPFSPEDSSDLPAPIPLPEETEPDSGDESKIGSAWLLEIADFGRSVDLGLIAAGFDLAARRATLQAILRVQVKQWSSGRASSLSSEEISQVDRLVEQLLAERPEMIGPHLPSPPVDPQSVANPLVIVPTIPIPVISVQKHRRWCPLRWRDSLAPLLDRLSDRVISPD